MWRVEEHAVEVSESIRSFCRKYNYVQMNYCCGNQWAIVIRLPKILLALSKLSAVASRDKEVSNYKFGKSRWQMRFYKSWENVKTFLSKNTNINRSIAKIFLRKLNCSPISLAPAYAFMHASNWIRVCFSRRLWMRIVSHRVFLRNLFFRVLI